MLFTNLCSLISLLIVSSDVFLPLFLDKCYYILLEQHTIIIKLGSSCLSSSGHAATTFSFLSQLFLLSSAISDDGQRFLLSAPLHVGGHGLRRRQTGLPRHKLFLPALLRLPDPTAKPAERILPRKPRIAELIFNRRGLHGLAPHDLDGGRVFPGRLQAVL